MLQIFFNFIRAFFVPSHPTELRQPLYDLSTASPPTTYIEQKLMKIGSRLQQLNSQKVKILRKLLLNDLNDLCMICNNTNLKSIFQYSIACLEISVSSDLKHELYTYHLGSFITTQLLNLENQVAFDYGLVHFLKLLELHEREYRRRGALSR